MLLLRFALVMMIALLGLTRVSAEDTEVDPEAILNSDPFEYSPQEVLAAAAKLGHSEQASFDVLLRERECEFTADGRRLHRDRLIYRVASDRFFQQQQAVIRQVWPPWYHHRPTLKARVVTPDGKVFALDPSTIANTPVTEMEPDVFSDHQMLHAPLPGVSVGAIVEEVSLLEERQPFCKAGVLEQFAIAPVSPNGISRIRIITAAEPPIQLRVLGSDVKPVVESDSGKTIYTIDSRNSNPWEIEPYAPRDTVQIPTVLAATGESWSEICKAYLEIIEKRIDAEAVAPVVKQLIDDGDGRQQRIKKLLAYVRKTVRYTGLQFGDASITPASPQATLGRRYGDCKDQSLLLVSLLSAAGIPANLAILRTADSDSVREDLPALNWFDHVIVFVPGERDLWIDPIASHFPPGSLPVQDQDRLALIIAPETRRLKRTPRSKFSENKLRYDFKVRLKEMSNAEVTIELLPTGLFDASYRSVLSSITSGQGESQLKNWMANYLALPIDSVEVKHMDKDDRAVELLVRASDSEEMGWSGGEEAYVVLDPSRVLGDIPWFLATEDDMSNADSGNEPAELRTLPIELPLRTLREVAYDIDPPPGFEIADLPKDESFSIGPVEFASEYKLEEDGSLQVLFRLSAKEGLLAPDQLPELQRKLSRIQQGQSSSGIIPLRFVQRAGKHRQAGKIAAAFADYRKLMNDSPEEPLYVVQYATCLLEAGFVHDAQVILRDLVQRFPNEAYIRAALANALIHDDYGRAYQGITSWDEAEEQLVRARELDGESIDTLWSMIGLLEHDRNGNRYADGSRIEEASPLYEALIKISEDEPDLVISYALHLLFSSRLEELDAWIQRHTLDFQLLIIQTAAHAVDSGVESAIDKLSKHYMNPDDERAVLASASDYLSYLKQYDLAVELLTKAIAGPANSAPPAWRSSKQILDQLRDAQPLEFLPDSDPCSVVQKLISLIYVGEHRAEVLDGLFAANKAGRQSEYQSVFRLRSLLGPRRQRLIDNNSPTDWTADLCVLLDLEVIEETQTHWIVTSSGLGLPEMKWIVVKESDRFLIQDPGEQEVELGARALECLEDSDLESATDWLKLAYEAQRREVSWFNAFGGSPFGRLWFQSADRSAPEYLKLAATSLLAMSDRVRPATVDILEDFAERNQNSDNTQIYRALVSACFPESPEKVLHLAEELHQKNPTAVEALVKRVWALVKLDRRDEAERVVEQASKVPQTKPYALYLLANLFVKEGRMAEAKEALLQAVEENEIPWLYSCLCRLALLQQKDLTQALAWSKKANEMLQSSEPVELGILAAAYAANGQDSEARNTLLQRRFLIGNSEDFDSVDWFVYGLRAEAFGLKGIAQDAYSRVENNPRSMGGLALHDLAQSQLDSLAERRKLGE